MDISELYGRRVLCPQIERLPIESQQIQTLPTLKVGEKTITCLRCGTVTNKGVTEMPNRQYYCPQCVTLGRVSTLDKFYHVPEPNQFEIPDRILTWMGQLSHLQTRELVMVRVRMEQLWS